MDSRIHLLNPIDINHLRPDLDILVLFVHLQLPSI